MWLLIAFIAVPLIEISLFIQVGGLIGLWPTLAIVLLTAFIGSSMVRSQGAREMANLRRSFNDLHDPTEPLANGAMIIFAGALLLTPGFFTDALGLALLFPPVRALALRFIKSRMTVTGFSRQSGHQSPRDTVIDGEFSEIDPSRKSTHPPSGWTKH